MDKLATQSSRCHVASIEQNVAVGFQGRAPRCDLRLLFRQPFLVKLAVAQAQQTGPTVGENLHRNQAVVGPQNFGDLANAIGAWVEHHDLDIAEARDLKHRAASRGGERNTGNCRTGCTHDALDQLQVVWHRRVNDDHLGRCRLALGKPGVRGQGHLH